MKRSMETLLKGSLSVIVALMFFVTMSGCGKDEGTMEKAGKKVEESIGQAKDSMKKTDKKATEGINKATKEMDDAAKKAMEKNKQ